MKVLLAKLFTAIGSTGQQPANMMLGAISILHKKGSKLELGNYRPIQLLNTDYRLMTKVLTNRLSECLAGQISKEQAAFLPGRRIGDNITFLQLLPQRLRQLGKAAVIAFLDFSKAYDTVCRRFLMEVMEVMGVGDGFLNWIRMLLTNTMSVAVVNGFISDPVEFKAGVKQGDPISPALYLYVGQALLCWLQANDIGIDLAGSTPLSAALQPINPGREPPPIPSFKVAAKQYAADTKALLQSLSQEVVQRFLGDMDTFAAACGQKLNKDKTVLLPVGAIPADETWQQAEVAGLKVVPSATALGITFTNNPELEMGTDWQARVDAVKEVYTKVTGMPLSAFGRAFAASGYGVSKMLYHAEFAGKPPEPVLQQLQRITRVLVDQGRLPGQKGGKRPGPRGIPDHLLTGHPSLGGFGSMAWQQHILGRHAWWAVRYMQYSSKPVEKQLPWVRLLSAILQHNHPLCKGYCLLESSGRDRLQASIPVYGDVQVGGPVRRIINGLLSLPPIRDISNQELQLGDWCAAAPLWGNPLLERARDLAGMSAEDRSGLSMLMQLPGVCTVRDAIMLYNSLKEYLDRGVSEVSYRRFVYEKLLCWNRQEVMNQPYVQYIFEYSRRTEALARIEKLKDSIPVGWRNAAVAAMDSLQRRELVWVDLEREAERVI
jgi:hypothetical protein